jgi:hypothetical protein
MVTKSADFTVRGTKNDTTFLDHTSCHVLVSCFTSNRNSPTCITIHVLFRYSAGIPLTSPTDIILSHFISSDTANSITATWVTILVGTVTSQFHIRQVKKLPSSLKRAHWLWDTSSILLNWYRGKAAEVWTWTLTYSAEGKNSLSWNSTPLHAFTACTGTCLYLSLPLHSSVTRTWQAKVKQSLYGLERPWGFQDVDAPRYHDNRHMKVERLSALSISRLFTPGNAPGTYFC